MFFIPLVAATVILTTASSKITPTLTSSPSATPTPLSNIDEIQKIREAVQQKVKEKLQEITQPTNTKKAIIGTITQIDPTSITITYQNQTSTLNINNDTVYIDSTRNKTKYEKLKEGQDILAYGIQTAPNVIETKRVVFIDIKTLQDKSITTIGKIADLSKSSPIFVLIPSTNKNTQYQIKYDSKTLIVDKNDSPVKSKDTLTSGDKIIAIIEPNPKTPQTFYANKIILLETKAQTSSPTPTPKKPLP